MKSPAFIGASPRGPRPSVQAQDHVRAAYPTSRVDSRAGPLCWSGRLPEPCRCDATGEVAMCRLGCTRSCLLARLLASEANGEHDVVA